MISPKIVAREPMRIADVREGCIGFAKIARWLLVVLAFVSTAAQAQTRAMMASTMAPDLAFPAEPTAPADLTRKMALLAPPGAGPFPAIVMIHQCAGLNVAVIGHAREAVARGFVVLLIDSFGPRSVNSVCYGPRGGVNLFRGVRDALQAVGHLQALPMVKPRQIGIVGYSWGAMIGLMAASPMVRGWLGFHGAPAATVAHYPGCFTIAPRNGNRSFEVFNRDVDVPLLALLGGDDTETPPDECDRKFRQAAIPEMLDWKVYPGATHCWDCQQIDGLRKTDVRGTIVSYRFDAEVTRDAMERTFSFLHRAFELK